MRCLWIARYMPYPLDAGAKVYSAKLAESLAAAGASVTFLGFGSAMGAPHEAGVEYVPVGSEQRSQLAAIVSRLPIAAAIDATSDYSTLLEEQLCAEWDAIVLDGYGSGWALSRCLAFVREQSPRRTVLVHIAHNHEAAIWRSMAREARGSLVRRAVLWQNALKVRALERRIISNVNVLSTISDEDRVSLKADLPDEQVLTLTPGYAGSILEHRTIDTHTPRRVIIVGSFRWILKQENLARFVECADPVFSANGMGLDVVGDVPDELATALKARTQATSFHGFVHDVSPLLAKARLAVVPELIGGGFKLKFLDYFFNRVPVATLGHATAGLPRALRPSMLEADDLSGLLDTIVANIDRIDRLNDMQQRAYQVARKHFRWEERGLRLRHAIAHVQRRWRHALDASSTRHKAYATRST